MLAICASTAITSVTIPHPIQERAVMLRVLSKKTHAEAQSRREEKSHAEARGRGELHLPELVVRMLFGALRAPAFLFSASPRLRVKNFSSAALRLCVSPFSSA
jgi:hypothetical protein